MDKIVEKAVWEGIAPLEEEKTSPASFGPIIQPRMMLCYRCGKPIPEDSKFCPCCGIELYTLCPKCGKKYSSQYLFCNECGTNKDFYIQEQNKEIFEERIKCEFAEQLLGKEKELNTAISSGYVPLYLDEDVQIIKTTEFVETVNFINKFIVKYRYENKQNNEKLDAAFVTYVKNRQISPLIKSIIDKMCHMILEENELLSLETNLMDSIILAYRKLHFMHYYEYFQFKKMKSR